MTEKQDNYTISDYVSQYFGMLIGEKMKGLSCIFKKCPKVLKYDSFIMSLEEILYI